MKTSQLKLSFTEGIECHYDYTFSVQVISNYLWMGTRVQTSSLVQAVDQLTVLNASTGEGKCTIH